MEAAQIKTCPRCNTTFRCCAASIETCACYGIPLNTKQSKQLLKQYNDCLCRNCLLEILNASIEHNTAKSND